MSKHVCQYAIGIPTFQEKKHVLISDACNCIRWRKTPCRRCSIVACRIVSIRPLRYVPWSCIYRKIDEQEKKLIACFFLKTSTCIFRFSRNGAETYYLYTTYTCLQEHMYGKYYWYYAFHLLISFSVDRMYIDAPGYNLSFFIYGLSLMYPLFAIVLLAFSLFWDIPIVAYMSTWNSESRNIWMNDER